MGFGKNRRNNEKHFGCAREMPALSHTNRESGYDITKSDVAAWLCSQPDIMQYVFDLVRRLKDEDGNPFITYDKGKNIWIGFSQYDEKVSSDED